MTQRKITSFFTASPNTSGKKTAAEEPKVEAKPSSNVDDNDSTDIDEIENQCDQSNKSPIPKSVPTVTIDDDDDTCEEVKGKPSRKVTKISDDEDEDDDFVFKPRSKAPKRIIEDDDDDDTIEDVLETSAIKRKTTPKRKAPAKVEDGIIGMKVRSPANGRTSL